MTRRFVLSLSSLLLLLGNLFCNGTFAQCFSYDVKVCIDGQDKLHIKGSQMWWEHIDFSPPGQHPDCSSYGVGIEVNGSPWTTWDSAFAISNTSCATLKDSTILCFNVCTLIQSPSAANGWETIYDFNDDAPGGPHLYEHLFTFCFTDTSTLSSSFTATTPVCEGVSSFINYTGTGTDSNTYNWNFGLGTILSGSGQGPYQVSWPGPGTYPVTLYVSGCGNSGTTTIPVKVNKLPSSAFTDTFPIPCVGQASLIQYTGNNSATGAFNWNFSDGIIVSGTGPGPYLIRWDTAGTYPVSLVVTDSGCTSNTTQKTLTVSPVPDVSLQPASPSICWGDSVNIIASGANYYSWVSPGGITLSADSSFTARPDSTITYTVTGANGTCADTTQLTVQVMGPYHAGVIASPKDTICNGQTIALTLAGSIGSVFWQSSFAPNNFTSTNGINDTVYDIDPSQTSYYRVIAGNGTCADTSATFKLVVNALAPPVIVSTDTIMCSSDSIQLHTTNSYVTYLWNTGDIRSYTYADYAGGYWVTVTDVNNCTALSDHKNTYVYPVPSVSIITNGNILESYNAVTYQWYYNDTLIPGATGTIYVAPQPGNYAVEITDSNGCTNLSNYYYIASASISNLTENDTWAPYPNPVDNELTIATNSPGNFLIKAELHDILGRITLSQNINQESGQVVLDVSQLATGVYCLLLETNKGSYIQKIVKK